MRRDIRYRKRTVEERGNVGCEDFRDGVQFIRENRYGCCGRYGEIAVSLLDGERTGNYRRNGRNCRDCDEKSRSECK